jgi:hypothetical protein
LLMVGCGLDGPAFVVVMEEPLLGIVKSILLSVAVLPRRECKGDLPKSCLREGRIAICWERRSGSIGIY